MAATGEFSPVYVPTGGQHRPCDCNLRTQVTCGCNSRSQIRELRRRVDVDREWQRLSLSSRLARVHRAKWLRIDTTREKHMEELHRLWRQSVKQPPPPRIEKHPRIRRHSAKG